MSSKNEIQAAEESIERKPSDSFFSSNNNYQKLEQKKSSRNQMHYIEGGDCENQAFYSLEPPMVNNSSYLDKSANESGANLSTAKGAGSFLKRMARPKNYSDVSFSTVDLKS